MFAKLTFCALLASQKLQPHSTSLCVDDSPLCLASPPSFTFRLFFPRPSRLPRNRLFSLTLPVTFSCTLFAPTYQKRPPPPKEQVPAACKMIAVGLLPSPGPLLKAFLGSKWVEGGTNCSVCCAGAENALLPG